MFKIGFRILVRQPEIVIVIDCETDNDDGNDEDGTKDSTDSRKKMWWKTQYPTSKLSTVTDPELRPRERIYRTDLIVRAGECLSQVVYLRCACGKQARKV